MPVVFDNVIGSVVDDATPPQTPEATPPPPTQSMSLANQLRQLDQRIRRLKAD